MSPLLQEWVSLRPYNTFGLDARARWYAEAGSDEDLLQISAAARELRMPLWVLGGGSNVLLTADVQAVVVRMVNRGIDVIADHGGRVVVEAQAGEPWHPFVLRSLERGLVGLENLSLIPGTVGAAPVQNIGAYGVELKDVMDSLTAVDLRSGMVREFSVEQCAFDYRDSLFKREPGRWVILRVRFALAREAPLHLEYGPIRQKLVEQGVTQASAMDVSRAVCAIRSEKLPDPQVLGNAGSFFKNPLVESSQAAVLRERYPDLVAYPQADGRVKLAAGWLIERAGWKGFRDGDAGVHRLQALVLVNYGNATGSQLLGLARRIQADILERFGVELEIEPNLL
ncbi:UDP-N-acetylenolpyruvoylglucosamine reductase [Stutzerimonas nosocomialis]|uniref:UDP-N-acetylenolpyruvoylglucosamine reductase n=1 Tax=Stutzerimonas nosocomialis TaxID=1056496 RepID=A0A5R9Q9R1_9GAMM|nr:UDP-N-acetylmuramate dehydrogenase [Stutzerimonas nosocomialis]TLX61740.1 UDP-N-acetylenolpyruvoylglucosamine reductase [Stutzerimonas nosocomialis]